MNVGEASHDSWASSEAVRRAMISNRRRDTSPELALRRLLHRQGLRYRVDYSPTGNLRRRADIVFTRRKLAVFVDGCFWHSCPLHGTAPKSNAGYWLPKLARNVERDRETDQELETAGWTVLRFWEHRPPDECAAEIVAILLSRNGPDT